MDYPSSPKGMLLLKGAGLVLLSLVGIGSLGCSMFVTVAGLFGADLTPAACDALKERRVAIITISNDGELGPTTTPQILSHAVGRLLDQNVKDISIISQQEMNDWIDTEGWDYIDAKQLARGVDAEILLKIDLSDFSIHDGQSMYRGSCVAGLTVYDLEAGDQVLWEQPNQIIEFPKRAGYPVTDYSIGEKKFEMFYINIVAHDLCLHFYPHDPNEDFARDATSIGN